MVTLGGATPIQQAQGAQRCVPDYDENGGFTCHGGQGGCIEDGGVPTLSSDSAALESTLTICGGGGGLYVLPSEEGNAGTFTAQGGYGFRVLEDRFTEGAGGRIVCVEDPYTGWQTCEDVGAAYQGEE